MYRSKRFIAFVVGLVLFVGLIFLTQYSPFELAGSISIITGIYITNETLRKSTIS